MSITRIVLAALTTAAIGLGSTATPVLAGTHWTPAHCGKAIAKFITTGAPTTQGVIKYRIKLRKQHGCPYGHRFG